MDTTRKVFDLVIIGAGMMGSAAAYYSSLIPGTSVCLVGPSEPKFRKDHEIFGCWFDEGRICCRVQDKHTWSVLSSRSVQRYRELERQTGINFYSDVGYIQCVTQEADFQSLFEMNHMMKAGAEDITKEWKDIYPFLSFPDDSFIMQEKLNAGHISPREQVRAHQTAAHQHGAEIIRKIVSTITPAENPEYKWQVETECGSIIYCTHVLVAAGGFAGLKNLFQHVKPEMVPDLDLRTQTVAYLRIEENEAQRLKNMPTLVTSCHFENLDGAYVLPPIRYPDGHWYLKLGHGRTYEEHKTTLEEVRDWYIQQTGNPECVEKLARFMCYMLPGLKVEEVTGDGCLTSHTPDEEPYIDIIAENFGVCLGGNGYGAAASDEMGRLAARLLMLGEWESDIPRERVKIVWKSQT
ncbi:monomeric sarcosine oxidase-like [Penaeus japonicus]|uniref:monomeric sarcosine oxidase-like n=1 Tax=Penaeus japonicus TaxID=27405 RepID=UPI001C71551B|nr:monomeric sarcosine oxidase-like [Penaeus japonicus]XP_042877244.1 monomeric sarcosine oxidase-like [Penaeus japonicus]